MPSTSKNRSSFSPSVDRRDRLTLAKLASYDDVATDALVDRAYFWTNTRKNRTKYNPARGIHDDDVAHTLLHDVIVGKDVNKAESKFLAMPGLKKYMAKLPNDREKEWFRRHLRKYIQMYLPDCPFEVTTTNRYTITVHEAAICARKFIEQGQEIKYLSGTLVPMTREEELDLDLKRKDFSIVMSSRKKTPSFFLGPARFANHDCNANGRLVTRGSEGMQVVAMRNIYIGEEITVSYGDDYFGIDNCECLCLTCERAGRNGWAAKVDSESLSEASTPVPNDETVTIDSSSSSKKRKGAPDFESDLSAPFTPRKRGKFERQGSKLREEISLSQPSSEAPTPALDKETIPVDSSSCPNIEDPSSSSNKRKTAPDSDAEPSGSSNPCKRGKTEELGAKLKEEISVPEIAISIESPAAVAPVGSVLSEEVQVETKQTNTEHVTGNTNVEDSGFTGTSAEASDQPSTPADRESSSSLTADESQQSSASTAPTSVCDVAVKVKADETIEAPADATKSAEGTHIEPPTAPQPHAESRPIGSDVELSDLSESWELDENLGTVVERVKSAKSVRRKRSVASSVEDDAPRARVPGDYTKTALLLAQRYDRWVDCQTCNSWFVQQDSYLTRRECPRCERHSKLYGFRWPKTDKEGPHDDEKRVMDHREIHRFLYPEEEARVSRKDRGVIFGITPTPEPSDTLTEADVSETGDERRTTRASRRRTREIRMTM